MVAQSLGIAKTQRWQGGHDSGGTMSAGMQITLMVNRGTPRTVELGPIALVGSGRAADVRVPDPGLAPLHLRLAREGGEVTAIALAAGVVVDGEEVGLDEPRVVTGCTVDVGPLRVIAVPHDVALESAAGRGRSASLARELVRDLMTGEDRAAPRLVVEAGPAAGMRTALAVIDERVVIGRGEHAGWVLLDPDLSRSHAAVVRSADGVRVYDLGSKNGTRVDGAPAPLGPPGVVLDDGALIGLGETQIRFSDPAAAMLADLEGRVAAAGRGEHAATTRTGGDLATRLAVPAVVRTDPPAVARASIPLGAVVAGLVALVAIALLVALFATST